MGSRDRFAMIDISDWHDWHNANTHAVTSPVIYTVDMFIHH